MELLSHKYKDATEVQLIEEARKTNPKADEDSYLPKMLTAWRRYGENALLGCIQRKFCSVCRERAECFLHPDTPGDGADYSFSGSYGRKCLSFLF